MLQWLFVLPPRYVFDIYALLYLLPSFVRSVVCCVETVFQMDWGHGGDKAIRDRFLGGVMGSYVRWEAGVDRIIWCMGGGVEHLVVFLFCDASRCRYILFSISL